MKTYYTGLTSIVAIFMTLVLFSCQDELIEPIDTSSTETDELMLNRGKPPKDDSSGRIDYRVSLSESHIITNDCDGSCNSKQDLLWFADDCHAEAAGLRLQSIRLEFGKSPAQCRVIMQNDTDTFFGDWTEESGVDELMDGFTQTFGPVSLHKKLKGKNKGLDPEVFATIIIGKISINKI